MATAAGEPIHARRTCGHRVLSDIACCGLGVDRCSFRSGRDGAQPPRLMGVITLKEVLKARARHVEEERQRERVLPLGVFIPFARPRRKDTPPARASGE